MTNKAAFVLLALISVLPAHADDFPVVTQPYAPRLGDIMGATQLRHMKLWYSGSEKNWPLATYELGQIRESFGEAMTYYPGLPISDMTTLAKPAAAMETAIKAKDLVRFEAAFRDLTNGCNDCHRAQGMGYIVIRLPNLSPFSDQVFAPPTPAN